MIDTTNTQDLIKAIEDHLVDDEKMLAAVRHQTAAAHDAFAELMTRVRREIDVASGGTCGARHLRG